MRGAVSFRRWLGSALHVRRQPTEPTTRAENIFGDARNPTRTVTGGAWYGVGRSLRTDTHKFRIAAAGFSHRDMDFDLFDRMNAGQLEYSLLLVMDRSEI